MKHRGQLLSIHHDASRPHISGPLVSVGRKYAVIEFEGTRKRVLPRYLRSGRANWQAMFLKGAGQ